MRVLLITLACLLPLAGCGGGDAEAEDRRLRGMTLEGQGKFHEALSEYEQGLQGHLLSAALWYHAGYLYLSGGDHAGAHRRFTAGLRLDRACAACAEGAGTAAFSLGNVADALPFLERALRLEPERAAARGNVAAALGKLAADVDSRSPFSTLIHPGGNPGANLKSISHRCNLFEVVFVWEWTNETIVLPLGCLQGGLFAV